jgi:hypothetical protein
MRVELIHHKPLTMDQILLESFNLRSRGGQGFPAFKRRVWFANGDDFPRVRVGQLAPAGDAAALADLSQIFANVFLSFFHFLSA